VSGTVITCGCGRDAYGLGLGTAGGCCLFCSRSCSLIEPAPPQQNQMLQEMLLQEKLRFGHPVMLKFVVLYIDRLDFLKLGFYLTSLSSYRSCIGSAHRVQAAC